MRLLPCLLFLLTAFGFGRRSLDSFPPEPPRDTLSVAAVGDLMLGTSFPSGYLPPDEGEGLLAPYEAELQRADVAFGNVEGTIYNGSGQMKTCRDSTKCYAFKSPEHYVSHFARAGFDLASVANNHSGDFGPEARLRTMELLSTAGIQPAGTLSQPYVIIRRAGLRIGMAAFAPNRGCAPMNDHRYAARVVRRLDSLCDVVIVSFHGGGEGAAFEHVTRKPEIFFGENRGNPYLFAHRMVDAGADLVLGHGPHVVRALELHRGRLIAYSLGNFATYGRFNLKGPNALAPLLEVALDRKGRFLNGRIHSAIQLGEGGPLPDPEGRAAQRMRELTREDFPEAGVRILEDGRIVKT